MNADFFNDIAAVFVVVLFAKFVAHRRSNSGHNRSGVLYFWHVVCTVCAAGGVFFSLLAVYRRSNWWLFDDLAWALLAASSLILIGSILIEDFPGGRISGGGGPATEAAPLEPQFAEAPQTEEERSSATPLAEDSPLESQSVMQQVEGKC